MGAGARRSLRGGWVPAVGLLLAGCATLGDLAATLPGSSPLRPTDPARLIGRWEGEVDLTFPERTLLVHSVTRKADGWAELGHGVFTYDLIEGLRGGADGTRDGIVSLQELYEYVEQQVTRKSRAVGGVSLIGNYRAQFDRVIRRSSYAELVHQVTARRDALLARKRTPPE
jgi:hypothetical protein